MKTTHNKFKRGSGCYECRCCGLQTRETGDGESDVRLCADCFELGGIENEASDYGDPDGKLAAEIAVIQARIVAKGGRL